MRQRDLAGLAIGYVFLGDKTLPPRARVKLDVTGSTAGSGYPGKADIPLRTVRYVNGQVVGIAKNTSNKKISGPISICAACFNKANRIVTLQSGFADKDNVGPGEEAPFSIDYTNYNTQAAPACAHILVSVRGYAS